MMMKRFLNIAVLVLVACSFAASQEMTEQQRIAKEELLEAARVYKAGRFVEAERHVRRALELDPNNRNAPLYLARSIHSQYKVDVNTPENVAVAERAIEVYKRIQAKDPNNDESFKAVAFLLSNIGRRAELIDWISLRAENKEVEAAKRSEAYVFLANLEWECSFEITERKENQGTVKRNGKLVIAFKKPKDPAVFYKAKQCASRGMELVERAITLDPESNKAWGFKTNLLFEMAKVSEMEGNLYWREEYKREAYEAQKRTEELSQRAMEKQRASENGRQPTNDIPAPSTPPPAFPLTLRP